RTGRSFCSPVPHGPGPGSVLAPRHRSLAVHVARGASLLPRARPGESALAPRRSRGGSPRPPSVLGRGRPRSPFRGPWRSRQGPATLESSWSPSTRPKTTIVSGRAMRTKPRPNSSGFSAIAPTVAPPTTFWAHAVAIPVPAMLNAAAIAASGSAMSLYLLRPSRTEGTERSPVALVKFEEGLHVVQTQGLNPGRNPAKEEDEHLGKDEEDKAHDDEDDLAGKDATLQDRGVKGGGDGGLPDSDSGEPGVRHDVREKARDLNRSDDRLGQAEEGPEDQDQRCNGDLQSDEGAKLDLDRAREPT